ncbi:MAG: hypothetical protein LBR82_10840, partial [Desulfovibrio sp.]|nr:hypothetical protein [Desulfovibrio sp.]
MRIASRLLSVLLVFSFAAPAAAYESLHLRNGGGNAVFRLDLFGRGEAYRYDSDSLMYGTRDFAATEIDDMRRGLDYWTAVLKPAGAPFTPVIVR